MMMGADHSSMHQSSAETLPNDGLNSLIPRSRSKNTIAPATKLAASHHGTSGMNHHAFQGHFTSDLQQNTMFRINDQKNDELRMYLSQKPTHQ